MSIQQAIQLHQSGRLAEADAAYRQILTQQPNHPDALHLLGVLTSQSGRHDQAAELVSRAITNQPNHAEYHGSLGLILAFQGKLDAAIASYTRALSIKPDLAQVHNNLGSALQAQGKLDAAAASMTRAISLRPDKADFHFNLANVLRQLNRLDECIARYRRGLQLQPASPQAHNNLGSALQAMGDLNQAVACYRQAVALRPNFASAHRNLGRAYRQLNQLDDCIRHCHAALALEPNSADDFNTLGSAFRAKGQLDLAMTTYQQALNLDPTRTDALNNLAEIYKETGHLRQAIECFERIVQTNPADAAVDSNRVYALHFDPGYDAPTLLREHRLWNQRHAQPLAAALRPHNPDRAPNRRLRIGYVSPDLRGHVVGWNLLPLLRHHDHARFEIFAYASLASEDATTKELRACCDTWHNIYTTPDEQAADLIRADKIDILIDLSLHMAHNRMLIFARKPAPVQATYLGYCSTTGLATMDYRLSDPYLDPPETDLSVYAEKTLRLPRTYWCYQPASLAPPPPIQPPPSATNGYVTFGCLNSFSKVSDAAIELWARVLQTVPRSKLLIHCPAGSHRDNAQNRFAARGIDAHRLDFWGYQSYANYLDTFNRIDIALDPLPYGGGITTCDGLWMGVPVITLSGQTAVGRGGRSLVSVLGLGDLVAHTQDNYVRLATEWERWIPLRPTLRQRMLDSPLMDATAFAKDVEAAFTTMWHENV